MFTFDIKLFFLYSEIDIVIIFTRDNFTTVMKNGKAALTLSYNKYDI